jgi:hypothetical protein
MLLLIKLYNYLFRVFQFIFCFFLNYIIYDYYRLLQSKISYILLDFIILNLFLYVNRPNALSKSLL